MPRAKADYGSLCLAIANELDRDGLREASMRTVQDKVMRLPGAANAELSRIALHFRKGKVAGWTMQEMKGQPLLQRKIVKLSVTAATAATIADAKVAAVSAEPSKRRVAAFGGDVLKYIPPTEPALRYHPRKVADGKNDQEVLERCWQERRSVLLYGKPGSGKSTAPWALAQKLGLPIVRISMEETKDSSKILGQWVPADGGGFRFVKAPALTMYEQGGCLVIEELNAITPGVAFTLHPMLDDLDFMTVDDLGVVVQRHPDFWVVATMNPSEDVGATGTQQVNYALWDRFKCKLFYDYDRAIEEKLVHGDTRILQVRDKLRGSNLRTEVTTRMLRDFWQNVNIFGWQIAKLMFVANFSASEREIVSEACKLIGG